MQLATVGHNQPPVDPIKENLQERNGKLLDTATNLLLEAEAVPSEIDDPRQAEDLSDLIKQLNDCNKSLDKVRVNEKQPYLDGGRSVDDFFRPHTDALTKAATAAKKPLTIYLNAEAEKQRKAQEAEAQRLRDEEAQRLAEAHALESQGKTAEALATLDDAAKAEQQADRLEASAASGVGLAVSKGINSTGALRKRWVGEIANRAAIDWNVLGRYLAEDAIQKAVNAFVAAGGRELAGVNIYEKSEAVVK